jgi:F-type H+-transporting ATPase subunit b
MITPHLPFADLNDIAGNFQNVGLQTGFTVQQFIAQCIAVTVLFLVLNQFAWKPVRAILEKRRLAIEESLANAERIKRELADAEKARLDILTKANDQANAIIAEAHKAAAAIAERGNGEAAAQAADIIRRAHEAAVLDRDRLLAELKREVGHLVIQTTQKVTGKVLTPDDQSRLNDETIRHLGAGQN